MAYTMKVLVVLGRNQGKCRSQTLCSICFADLPILERDFSFIYKWLVNKFDHWSCFLHLFWSPSRGCPKMSASSHLLGNTAVSLSSNCLLSLSITTCCCCLRCHSYFCQWHDPPQPPTWQGYAFQTEAGLIFFSFFVAFFATQPPTENSVSSKISWQVSCFWFYLGFLILTSIDSDCCMNPNGNLYSSKNYVIIVLLLW